LGGYTTRSKKKHGTGYRFRVKHGSVAVPLPLQHSGTAPQSISCGGLTRGPDCSKFTSRRRLLLISRLWPSETASPCARAATRHVPHVIRVKQGCPETPCTSHLTRQPFHCTARVPSSRQLSRCAELQPPYSVQLYQLCRFSVCSWCTWHSFEVLSDQLRTENH
jgi:hypothetical protein